MSEYKAYIDGACLGNPGDAGIGIVIYKGDTQIVRESKYLGTATNNIAECTALLTLLQICRHNGIKEVEVFSDSELTVKQVTGEYKIKDEKLRKIHDDIKSLSGDVKFTINHIPREKNSEADKLSKEGAKRGDKLKNV